MCLRRHVVGLATDVSSQTMAAQSLDVFLLWWQVWFQGVSTLVQVGSAECSAGECTLALTTLPCFWVSHVCLAHTFFAARHFLQDY